MTRPLAILALVLLAALPGCDDEPDDGADRPDAAAGASDAGTDAADRVDADPASCDPSQTSFVIGDRPIQIGDYCDDVSLCAADQATAAAVEAAAPGFDCDSQGGGCADGEVYCAWYDPGEIDADDWAAICAITVLDDPPLVRCWLYL